MQMLFVYFGARIDFLSCSQDKKKSKFCILTSKYDVIKKFETNKQKDVDISIRISNDSSLKKLIQT